MYILLFALMLSLPAFAQNFTPNIDPNKFTICAITINSDDEKKVFQKEVAKFPKKFNPIVELTDFSDYDWFDKACSSGIRCDQLIISGHFGGTFFGEVSEKTLSLAELERKGCSKSCEGILNQPYEVFLMGCNTLAGKEGDHRTPEQYYEVLINDGIPAGQAELVVQSRYGNIGDTNKAAMQRAFMGLNKKLYGFDSVGPSGKNVKGLLENYMKKVSLPTHLEKLAAKRMMNQVAEANTKLAESLKSTAFTECDTGNMDNEKVRNICKLQDEKVPLLTRLTLVEELLTHDDFLIYIPYISRFVKDIYKPSLVAAERQVLDSISKNETVKRQMLGLADKTLGLGFKIDILKMSEGLGFIGQDEVDEITRNEIIKMFDKPLTLLEKDTLCSIESIDIGIQKSIRAQDLKNNKVGINDIEAYNCLNFHSLDFVKRAQTLKVKASDKDQTYVLLDYFESAASDLPEKFSLSASLQESIALMLKDPEVQDWGLELANQFLKPTPQSISVAKKSLNSDDDYSQRAAIEHLRQAKDKDPKTIVKAISLSKKMSCAECALFLMEAGRPEGKKMLIEFLKPESFEYEETRRIIKYFQEQGKIDREFQELILNQVEKNLNYSFNDINIGSFLKAEKYDPDLQDKIKAIKKKVKDL